MTIKIAGELVISQMQNKCQQDTWESYHAHNVKANTDADGELYDYDYTNSAQSQKAVTTYFSSKQLLFLALKRIWCREVVNV